MFIPKSNNNYDFALPNQGRLCKWRKQQIMLNISAKRLYAGTGWKPVTPHVER